MAGDETVDFFATFAPDRDRMRATGVPLTVVMAEESRGSWSGTASRWLAAGTGAELLELPGGHVGFLADPDGLVELVDRVAGSHMPAAGGGS
jgi:hypothetical protein